MSAISDIRHSAFLSHFGEKFFRRKILLDSIVTFIYFDIGLPQCRRSPMSGTNMHLYMNLPTNMYMIVYNMFMNKCLSFTRICTSAFTKHLCTCTRTCRCLSTCSCSLSLWRVARGSKHMFLELIHHLFIT
jgi:hypothetical protein